MEIRLLGNLEVVVDGVTGTLPGAGERALLALLALQAGRVVSADRLVDTLWGERLPANPANALQTRVSKLRRSLAALGADGTAVATVPPGYRLDVDTAAVDALRVEREIGAARAAADAGQAEQARERYRSALSSWRGVALADFLDEVWAGTESRRLEELRLAAVQEQFELELQAGRHAEVVTELEALVAAHPLRERLYGQLMLALYRCGRQADALAVYQRARETLDSELGLDPSAELRDLEAAILRQDEALAAPTRAPVVARREGNVPSRVATFVGRDDDVEEITRLLDGERLVTITGPGGAGKTTLALEAARRVADRFPDGAWFVDLSGATDPDHVTGVVAETLELPVAEARSGESREARLARQLHGHRCLIVLDNCEHLVDASAALVDRVLGGSPGVRVLATSREALAVSGEVQYTLAPLSLDAAVELFAQRARAASRTFTRDETTEPLVAELCGHLDGMPLAIELAAARVKTLPLEEIRARLGDRFRLLSGGNRTAYARHQTLRATVDWSYELLSESERLLLQRLSVFRGRWTVESAEQVCADEALPAADVLDLLGRLVDRSLVVAAHGRFRLLETIRDYAAERLEDSGGAQPVIARNHARLLHLVQEWEPEFRRSSQRDAVRVLSDELDDLRAALAWCAKGGDVALGQRIAAALAWFWFLGDHEEGRRTLRALLDAGGTDEASRARALHALSIVERPGACLVHPHAICADAARQARAHFAAEGDATGEAMTQISLAVDGILGTEVDANLRLLDEAEVALADDRWHRALIDFVRMEILVRWGDPEEGLAVGERSFAAFAALQEPWGMSGVLAHRGHNLRVLGRLEEALEAFDEALAIARDAGLLNTVQGAAGEAGMVRALLGDDDGARRGAQEAAEVAKRHGQLSGSALAELVEGLLARNRGDDASARAWLSAAVESLRQVGSLPYLAAAWSALGHALEVDGQLDAAERAHREVGEIARGFPDPWVVAATLEGMAGVAAARDEAATAAELLGAAAAARADGRRPADPLAQRDIERITARTRAALTAKSYDSAFARGRKKGAARHLELVAG